MVNIAYEPALFVGREAELTQISALLTDPACRLLTLVGPGGVGKTRLAWEAARQPAFPDGVHFVPLQPLTSPDYIISAIADAVGFQFYSGAAPKQQLLDYFREKSLLLVLDNLEHLLEGVTLLSEILGAAPAVRILATSRERLNLREEWVLEVGGLPYPANAGETDIESYSSVALFMQHARRVKVSFRLTDAQQPAVVRICRLVGGMPLGIELAASWVRALSCETIADEIEHSLEILETPARNVEPRHRNIRAALDQSWHLLSETERDVFMKLSMFRGGFTREAAEKVAGASLRTLTALVDKSLVRVDANGRYDVHELLRQYGAGRLEASAEAAEQTRDGHCQYYSTFLAACPPRIKGREVKAAFDDITIELDNVRAMWDWALRHRKIPEIEASLFSLSFFYGERGRYQEGDQAFARAAACFDDSSLNSMVMRAQIQICRGAIIWVAGSRDLAKALLLEAETILRRVEPGSSLAWELTILGMISVLHDLDLPRGAGYLYESLALYKKLDDPFHVAHVLHWLCTLHQHENILFKTEGALERARQYALEGLAINRQLDSPHGTAISWLMLGFTALLLDEYEQAFEYAQKGLGIFREIGVYWGISNALNHMAHAAWKRGEYTEARRSALQSLRIETEHRFNMFIRSNLFVLANIWLAEGRIEWAYELMACIDQELERTGDHKRSGTREILNRLKDAPPQLAAAVERGRARDFDTTVKEVIAILSQEVDRVSAESSPSAAQPQALANLLTTREHEILCLIADGLSNVEIAQQFVLATSTVKWHVNQIFGKLDVTTRTQAVARARALGLLA